MPSILPLATAEDDRIEALLDRAFGADRHTRTAYAVRAGTQPIGALSFAAWQGDVLIGTIQCWPVVLACDGGDAVPLTMVGPVAVDPPAQRAGLGHLLVERMLAAAHGTGDDAALMLIGDPGYYGRFFGFDARRTAGWRLPGPVERHRLLARGPLVPCCAGVLGPRHD